MTKEEPSKTRKELKMKEKELSKTKEGIIEQIIESTGESISVLITLVSIISISINYISINCTIYHFTIANSKIVVKQLFSYVIK